jgi:hypothetical protein
MLILNMQENSKVLENLKVFSPGYQAIDWGFDYPQVVDLSTALAQPIRIASLPVFYNDPADFAYKIEFQGLDLDQFDLVLFTDIEFRKQRDIMTWIETVEARNWLLSVGGLHDNETLDSRTIYRPTWMFTFLQWNAPRDDFYLDRPFLWESLLGARRPNRDFIMLAMQQSGLLDQSIVTYRDIFVGNTISDTPEHIQKAFPSIKIQWPYVSPNLDPDWEVRGGKLDNTISSEVPWHIWNRCYYSIIAETLGQGHCFFPSEKFGKCCLARRLFVAFATCNWLNKVKQQGFQTFDAVLDESYDSIEDGVQRWTSAFDQVKMLSKQNPRHVLEKIKPVLDHNHNHLFAFKKKISEQMSHMITQAITQVRDPV